jgi:hypothetical protein
VNGTITITLEEYTKLINDQTWLRALEAAGLDNWQGIDNAIDIMQEWHDKYIDHTKEELYKATMEKH